MFLHLALVATLAKHDGVAPQPAVEAARAHAPAVASESKVAPAPRRSWTLDQILEALRVVETGGEKDGGRNSTGDGGGAIGPFQIHHAYWKDTRMKGRWQDCRDPRYAREVVLAYWRRYCPKALESLDAQTLARIHNGGPDGAREKSTLKFWAKVERELVRQHEAREKKRARESKQREPAVPKSESGAMRLEKRRSGSV